MFNRVKLIFSSKNHRVFIKRHNFTHGKNLHKQNNHDFFAKLYGINIQNARELVIKHKLEYIPSDEAEKSLHKLEQLKYSIEEIRGTPGIFVQTGNAIENRQQILNECGFQRITVSMLYKYVTISNKKIKLLETHNYIDKKSNLVENLLKHIDIDLCWNQDLQSDMTLILLRKCILNLYFVKKFGVSDEKFEHIYKIYPRIKHRSFQSILKCVEFAEKECNFTPEKIVKNSYIFHSDVDNLYRMLKEIPKIAGFDIREVLFKFPKLFSSNSDYLKESVELIQKAEIPDSYLARSLHILTLSPVTISKRISDLKSIEELNVLRDNPRIVRLLHLQNKAKERLNFLRENKIKCASLHILTSTKEDFEKYVRDGSDRTRGRDVCKFLALKFNKSEDEIRAAISRHPNWCHVSLLAVQTAYNYLQTVGYSIDDIYMNIHLTLYPVMRIESKLIPLENGKSSLTFTYTNISKSQLLGLCLYAIELEFHFSGDGIWTDPAEHQHHHTTDQEIATNVANR